MEVKTKGNTMTTTKTKKTEKKMKIRLIVGLIAMGAAVLWPALQTLADDFLIGDLFAPRYNPASDPQNEANKAIYSEPMQSSFRLAAGARITNHPIHEEPNRFQSSGSGTHWKKKEYGA